MHPSQQGSPSSGSEWNTNKRDSILSKHTNMENTSPLILDGRDGSQSPEDIVDELQAIITDVDAFLSNWFRRLEQGSLSCDPTKIPDLILQKRFKELQNERVLLEAKRKSDERQTQEKAQQLTQAWLQLEEEQRKFLQMKDPPRQAGYEGGSTSSVANRPAARSLRSGNRSQQQHAPNRRSSATFIRPIKRNQFRRPKLGTSPYDNSNNCVAKLSPVGQISTGPAKTPNRGVH